MISFAISDTDLKRVCSVLLLLIVMTLMACGQKRALYLSEPQQTDAVVSKETRDTDEKPGKGNTKGSDTGP